MSDQLFNKIEISAILKKASEIQTQKDLYGDKEGLTEEELVALASEVGIDKDSLLEAITARDDQSFKNTFNWITGTSKVQNITTVSGEINDEIWDEIIREIRKIVGGIGKDSNHRTSYEWEQRLKEIGYRHISLTPIKGKSKIQYVYSWSGIRFMSNLFGFMIPSVFIGGQLEDTGISLIALLSIAALGGLSGVLATRLFLKPYFEKQKRLMQSTIQAISQKLKSISNATILIEEDAYEDVNNLHQSSTNSLKES